MATELQETNKYRSKYSFPTGYNVNQQRAVVGGPFAIVGGVHVGEEGTTQDEFGWQDRIDIKLTQSS